MKSQLDQPQQILDLLNLKFKNVKFNEARNCWQGTCKPNKSDSWAFPEACEQFSEEWREIMANLVGSKNIIGGPLRIGWDNEGNIDIYL